MKILFRLCAFSFAALISSNTFSQKISQSYPARIKERPGIFCMDSDAQGNLIFGGNFQFYKNEQIGSLIKVAGTDNTIHPYAITARDGNVGVVKALPDGKTLALLNAGAFGKIVRFNSDGTLDSTFPEVSDYSVQDFKLQSDGKIIVLGDFTDYKGSGYNYIVRLNPNGQLDTTFPKPQATYNSQRKIVIDKDDNIFFTELGKITKISKNGEQGDFVLGNFMMTYYYQIIADQQGRLIVTGELDNKFKAYRINADGSKDDTFNTSTLATGYVFDMLEKPNGNLLVSGRFFIDGHGLYIIELNPDGTMKKSYDVSYGNNLRLFQDNSGNLFAYGEVSYGTEREKSIVKISDTGISEFAVPIYTLYYTASSAVQKDGKLVVSGTGGNFGVDDLRDEVLRLDSDGSVDAGFQCILSNELARQIIVQDDDKILAVTNNEHFVRMSPDGGSDLSFSTGAGFKVMQLDGYSIGYVQSVKVKNSKIFVSGIFNNYNNETHNNFVILDLNGKAIGPEKNLAFQTFSLREMAVRSDEKVILWGNFKFEGKDQLYSIIQLNADGSFEKGLLVSPNPYYPTDIEVDEHDRLLIVGQFDNFLGSGYSSLVRLNPDGTVDNTFKATSIYLDDYGIIKSLGNDKIAIGGVGTYKAQNVAGFVIVDGNGNQIPVENNIDMTSRVVDLAYGNNTLYAIGRIETDEGKTVAGAAKIVFPIENPEISDMSVEIKSDSSATISWDTEMVGADQFVISQSETGLNYVAIDTVSAALRTYDANKLKELTTYYFSVYGMNENGKTESVNSNGTTFIKTPKALPATEVTASSFVANWSGISNTQNYFLQVSDDNFATFVSGYENLATTATSAPVNNLTPGTYQFRVKRKRDEIFSDLSAPVEVSTLMMVGVQPDKNSETVFYPNPVQDKIIVRTAAETQFEIIGLNGVVLKTNAAIQNELPVLDLSDLARGFYVLKTTSKHGVVSYKLVKE
jgi:uncharacterized delta-60 repeat protein